MGTFSIDSLMRRPEMGSFLGMVFVTIFFTIFGGFLFLSPQGVASWLNVAANLGIIAIPVGFLMIAGELDISVGAMLPAASMTTGILSGYYGLPIIVGILAPLALGALVGTINGFLVIRTNVPSLIITMGTLFALAGLSLFLSVLLTNTTSATVNAPVWAKAVFGSFIGGTYQILVLWWLALMVLHFYFLHLSTWGNWVYAMGGDKVSARNAGIPTEKLTLGLFILSSVSASFVGMCQAILFNSAQVSAGQSYIAVVVGGVLLTGGFGSVVGIVFGTITFAIVNQGIYFTGFDRNLSSLIIGTMLLVAVLMNNTFRKLALTYRPKRK
jgi:simple sugar transport system permease protein